MHETIYIFSRWSAKFLRVEYKLSFARDPNSWETKIKWAPQLQLDILKVTKLCCLAPAPSDQGLLLLSPLGIDCHIKSDIKFVRPYTSPSGGHKLPYPTHISCQKVPSSYMCVRIHGIFTKSKNGENTLDTNTRRGFWLDYSERRVEASI